MKGICHVIFVMMLKTHLMKFGKTNMCLKQRFREPICKICGKKGSKYGSTLCMYNNMANIILYSNSLQPPLTNSWVSKVGSRCSTLKLPVGELLFTWLSGRWSRTHGSYWFGIVPIGLGLLPMKQGIPIDLHFPLSGACVHIYTLEDSEAL